MSKGKLIVIEGGDGAGKATQTKLLIERLTTAGRQVETMSFPQYGKPSAANLEAYLKKQPGFAGADPKIAAQWFAEDRATAIPTISTWLGAGHWVVLDRWSPSNMVHQGMRILDPEARTEFLHWLDRYEHDELGMLRPDLTIVLSVDASIRDANVEGRGEKDAHEGDRPYQERVEASYREVAMTLPGFVLIECQDSDNDLMPKEIIHELVWQKVSPLLQTT